MDFVGPIIEIVTKIIEIANGVRRYLEDQIKFNESLEEFSRRKDDLPNQRDDIESKLRTELRHGKVAKREVERWLNDAQTFITRPAVEDEVNGWGWLSWYYRVEILKERFQELEEIYERGDRYTDECLVIDDPAVPAVELPVSKLQGSEAVKANILACLKGEEVTMLGVWGMGGVGKTTIMKHVHNELLKEGKFKKIIWVDVSQNFDINNLQKQIAYGLKKKLEEDQNTTIRASTLSMMLEKQKPYLLILDDVWGSFKLEDAGIPKPDETNSCKLVLTTRSQQVAHSMDCSRIIKVETLSGKGALELFLNKVGDTTLSCQGGGIKRDLESTLEKIVAECNGLPLAIVTVASSLKGISKPSSWRAALNQLRDCRINVTGTVDDVFKILKFSYDRLENSKIQSCFSYCALYPEDYNIPKEEIIEYWIDEGFIVEMETRHDMKDLGYDILRKLEDNSLLEFIKDIDRGDCVRMHDLIRDMALQLTMSPRFLVEAGKALKELPERVNCAEGFEKVSLMHNYIEEIPSSLAFSTCTMLTTLLLAYNKLSTIPESIFEHMPELKILDLSFNVWLISLPNSISKLVKLTTLLLESTYLEKVPSLSGLGFLKKLDLRGTRIKEVPEGLGMLKNLKCLFLSGTEIVEIADGVLSNLSKLQELLVNESKIKLKGDVVGRLKKLEVFCGWFPTVNEMRIFLKCQPNRLSGYFISVGRREVSFSFVSHEFDNRGSRLRLRAAKVVAFTETSIVGENVLFPSIQTLVVEGCHDIRSLNGFSKINDAEDLRECWIQECDGMECIFPSWMDNRVVLTVEYLGLYNLHKLDGLFEANIIAKSTPPPGTFSSLKVVWIWRCKKIKKLFPSWKLVEYLQSLERIEVFACEEMEEIIASDPEEGGEGGGDINDLILPKLKGLMLKHLPALKSICSRRAVMVSNSLEDIEITNCKGLRRIPFRLFPHLSLDGLDNLDWVFEVELIAMSPPQPCTFLSLKKIKIQKCRRVKKLFPSWKLVEYLQNLEEIDVRYCEEMEEIIASDPEEEGEEGGDIIKELILPKLKKLMLRELLALRSICSRRAVMVFDSLEDIEIIDCKGLRRIPFRLFPHRSLDGLDNLDWLFEVELIAMSPPQPRTFSFLKSVRIGECKKLKKLFPSWKLVEYLQNLEVIVVTNCEEMEEIIASDPEEEGEGGDIIKKLILPKLKELELRFLPALKSICSRRVVMVCDSLEDIQICACEGLRRMPLFLPLVDNAQPSPPPSLKKIFIRRQELEWWESLEWDHPNAKDVLEPMVRFFYGNSVDYSQEWKEASFFSQSVAFRSGLQRMSSSNEFFL
ncbi:hypothetical protein SLEP1_g54677 [Rubroshorea leprosula]|uniref:Uncharacterized protein n=1 Tax=Rubroshorea leprosula TaxID=152421 RepID=A0AAV5MD69_9ROSI|nr:hypothetical protein SLEP1_g54677 [Rubroshorea leprosula]